MKIAVITRTKDRLAFLERAIKSVQVQTYKDYVHVIFNNGGDASAVEELVKKCGVDVKVVHSENTISRAAALNAAIRSVDSEYVAVHDDDDTWHANFLEQVVGVLDGGASGVVVKTDKVIESVSDGQIKKIKSEVWMPDLKVISLYQQCIDNQMTPIAFAYGRAAYEAVGGYDESLNVLEDFEFGIRFLQKYDVEFIDPGYALANYHHRQAKAGVKGDNSFADSDHRYYFNLIANKYLRAEMAEGRLGVGYIMSKLKYDQSYMARVARRLLPKRIVKVMKNRVRD